MNTGSDANKSIQLTDFLNPNSMITPGAAGGATMIITNTLCSQFDVLPGNWTALALSFLFGSLTFVYSASVLKRAVYLVINSLIIFVMAHGSNSIGMSATKRTASAPATTQVGVVDERNAPPRIVLASLSTDFMPSLDQKFSKPAADQPTRLAQDSKKKSGFFRQWDWQP